ncbi:MAG TPA: serine/threonine-protein kinase [Trebonia sp.]|nr:serine/threonine-protein kinase [Trebonia sp.]
MGTAGQGRLVAGRYRLSMVIGRGGMGVVWLARDELLSRDVAVKEILWPPHFTEPEQREACRRASAEAQMAARLNHRNVIRVFDSVEEDGYPWIVMELLPFRSLRDLVEQDGPLTPAQAAWVGLGILAALRAAHAEGVVHRDVKPANILIGPDRVVLTDFGIACAADDPAHAGATALIGSPSYIAPERAKGKPSGPPSDLWGLGASLYAAVEGHPPFDRDGARASLLAVVTEEPVAAEHAGALWPVISGLLRKDPAERLAAAETERMLHRAASAPADNAPVDAAPEPDSLVFLEPFFSESRSSESRRARGPLAALAWVAALIVLAVGSTVAGLTLTSSPGHPPQAPAAISGPPAADAAGPAIAQPPALTKHSPAPTSHPTTPSGPHLTVQTTPTEAPVVDHPARLSDRKVHHHHRTHYRRHHRPADSRGGSLHRHSGNRGAETGTPPGPPAPVPGDGPPGQGSTLAFGGNS